jgi:hypothetical protein
LTRRFQLARATRATTRADAAVVDPIDIVVGPFVGGGRTVDSDDVATATAISTTRRKAGVS